MSWRLMTAEEAACEWPRATSIIAAAALTNDEGELYVDTCFALHDDGTVTLPPTELPFDELTELLERLRHTGSVRAVNAPLSASPAALPDPETGRPTRPPGRQGRPARPSEPA